jgi:hypothetical protein
MIYKMDSDKIRQDLAKGLEIEGCKVGERKKTIRIS